MIALLCIFHCIIIAKHSLICSDLIQSDHIKRYASPSMPAVISCCHSNLSSVCPTYRYTVRIQHPGYVCRYSQTSDMSYPRKSKCPSCKDIQKVILIFLTIFRYKTMLKTSTRSLTLPVPSASPRTLASLKMLDAYGDRSSLYILLSPAKAQTSLLLLNFQ